MTEPDRVGAALWSIVAGSTGGAAANAAALLLFERTAANLPFVFAGSLLVGIGYGLTVSRRVGNAWRRAVTGAVCAFGGVLLMLATIIVDVALHAQALGIAAWGLLLTAAALFAGHRAWRG